MFRSTSPGCDADEHHNDACHDDARHNDDDGTGGFTLLEVLVALALVAGGLSAIGGLVATNIRATRALDQRLALTETARAVLAALPDPKDLAPGSTTGEIGGHRWRVDVRPLAGAATDSADFTLWQPLALAIRVEAPTGQVLRMDTVRLHRNERGRQ